MLRITPSALALIRDHAAAAFPEECCGLLIGSVARDEMLVVDALPARNLATSNRSTRYTLDPRGFLFAEGQARERNLDVIGVYHSHPEHSAEPSATDSQLAWDHFLYLIVPVGLGGTVGPPRVWQFSDQEPHEVAISVQ